MFAGLHDLVVMAMWTADLESNPREECKCLRRATLCGAYGKSARTVRVDARHTHLMVALLEIG